VDLPIGEGLIKAELTRVNTRLSPGYFHPRFRPGRKLTVGEQAADAMRNGMGSWLFVICALLFFGNLDLL